ncbi:MAG TPA: cysteine hydrolase [Firmicutes bacterium]|jgi:nicotinamidase-related amidase|nr:cysteine hydrolase [Bacillota bacterium]
MTKNIAVVSIDMHRGHLDPEVATLPLLPAERCETVIKKTAEFYRALRKKGVPIVHIVTSYRDAEESLSNPHWKRKNDEPNSTRKGMEKHNLEGSVQTEIIPELYEEGDYIVIKKRYSAFYQTDLEFLLRRYLKVDSLIITGINTSSCCLCTSFDATNRDFTVYMVEDCMDSMDGREFHEAALLIMNRIIGQVVGADELLERI